MIDEGLPRVKTPRRVARERPAPAEARAEFESREFTAAACTTTSYAIPIPLASRRSRFHAKFGEAAPESRTPWREHGLRLLSHDFAPF